MKLSITCLLLFALVTSSFAQTEEGSFLIGGTAGFNNQFEDGDDIFSFDLSPNVGLFVADDIALGANISVGYASFGEFNQTTLTLAPFGRIYIGASDNMKFLVEASGGYLYARVGGDLINDPEGVNGYIVSGGPGVAFFLNENVAIEGILGYTRVGGDFNTNSNLAFRFGVQAYLGGGSDD